MTWIRSYLILLSATRRKLRVKFQKLIIMFLLIFNGCLKTGMLTKKKMLAEKFASEKL